MSFEKIHYAVTLILCFSLFFVFFYEDKRYNPNHDIKITKETRSQKFLKFIYVASSKCPICNDQENNKNILRIKKKFKHISDSIGVKLSFIGVAKEKTPYMGVRHLQKTGNYDEIIAGMGPYNTAYQKYVWDENLEPGTPKIMVFEASYLNEPKGNYIYDVKEEYNLSMEIHGFAEIDSLSNVRNKNILDYLRTKIRRKS